ncbi:hypothetical protein EJ05DRAFT_510840 [Pseudovirgaria hyperparasitica]|uniref:DUF1772-domain-containing protein n=1 Tax=Pseudovirgaria hyperparasitica TaxID=470096 RepID=A0A6A6W4X9_9PEZI|nr:uncharacterized protein EJ05DRAFT_510840 [Pseudovirgaria hyperparasitica]KAF2757988.1 hypothetical protein EJ05DRAFT_510840 [Pseudovirgaria hyperparasitica]
MSAYAARPMPSSVKVVQCIGITSAAYLLGQVVTLSTCAIPAILQAPAPLAARQWVTMFVRARALGIAVTAIPVVAFSWLAWKDGLQPRNFKLYLTAALMHFLVFPYTMLVILPTNNKLEEKAQTMSDNEVEPSAAEAGIQKEETVHALVDKWGLVAIGRAVLAGVGTVCGLMATVKQYDVVIVDLASLAKPE